MKKKRLIIVTVCVLLAVLMIGSLFVAAGIAFANADNLQFGGLVGELLADKNTPTTDEPTSEQDSTAPDWEEVMTNETPTEDSTYEDSTNPPEPPPTPDDTPALRFFLGSGAVWIGNNKIANFIEPGKASEWNHHAVIEDYKAEYILITGWAAIFTETPMQLGYQIDDGQPVYGHYSGFSAADQATTMAALGMGAIRAADVMLDIPVQNLSGTHTVNILVRNQDRTGEGVISTFTIEKAEPPYVFMADAKYLADMLENERSAGIESYQYLPGIYPEKGYVFMQPIADFPFPAIHVCPYNGEVYSTGARYLVIKCRNYGPSNAYVNVGSGLPALEDSLSFTYTGLDWQLIIIDLSQASPIAVNSSYDITTLDFVIFRTPADTGNYCEIAWIATFKTIEDAQRYDADHPYAKG